jgi:hypothetical protein
MSGVAMKNPAQGMGFGRRLSGFRNPSGDLGLGGMGGTPEGAFNATLFIDALQANGPFSAGWPSRRRSPAAPVARGPHRRRPFLGHAVGIRCAVAERISLAARFRLN